VEKRTLRLTGSKKEAFIVARPTSGRKDRDKRRNKTGKKKVRGVRKKRFRGRGFSGQRAAGSNWFKGSRNQVTLRESLGNGRTLERYKNEK